MTDKTCSDSKVNVSQPELGKKDSYADIVSQGANNANENQWQGVGPSKIIK